MKLFKVNTDLKSYAFPVVKIVCNLILIACILLLSFNIDIPIGVVNFIFRFVLVALILCFILSIYLSFGEIICVYENRQKDFLRKCIPTESECERKSIEYIKTLTEQNDIVEILIKLDNEIIKVGTSSNSKQSSAKLYDKRYYIEQIEYTEKRTFYEELSALLKNEEVFIYSVDGVRTMKKEYR